MYVCCIYIDTWHSTNTEKCCHMTMKPGTHGEVVHWTPSLAGLLN